MREENLPYSFDLFFDLKTHTQLVKYYADLKHEIRLLEDLIVRHNIEFSSEENSLINEEVMTDDKQCFESKGFLKSSTTVRGFRILTFTDHAGEKCSLQKSSLATEDAIWVGVTNLKIKRFPGDRTGWHPIDLEVLYPGQDIISNARMHLTQEQVQALLPALSHFAETGELPT